MRFTLEGTPVSRDFRYSQTVVFFSLLPSPPSSHVHTSIHNHKRSASAKKAWTTVFFLIPFFFFFLFSILSISIARRWPAENVYHPVNVDKGRERRTRLIVNSIANPLAHPHRVVCRVSLFSPSPPLASLQPFAALSTHRAFFFFFFSLVDRSIEELKSANRNGIMAKWGE